MNIAKLKVCVAGMLIAICCLLNASPARADSSMNQWTTSYFQIQDLSSIRKIGEPLRWEEQGLKSQVATAEEALSEQQLLRLSVRLRDIARYLGSSWPAPVPLPGFQPEEDLGETERSNFQITALKKNDGSWTTLTVGYTLALVTQQLSLLPNSKTSVSIDVLVRDDRANIYRPVLDFPLWQYCAELLKTQNL